MAHMGASVAIKSKAASPPSGVTYLTSRRGKEVLRRPKFNSGLSVVKHREALEEGNMATQPPLDFTALATRLVNSCAEKNFISMAEVLEHLDPDRVDVAVFTRGTNAHLNFVGAFRSISFPRFPQLIASPPDIARIAQVLAEVAR
jgi:hypothetical protein